MKNNLKNNPDLKYNIDKYLQPEHKPSKIASARHDYKATAITSGKSKMANLMAYVNGVGQQVQHFFFVFTAAMMIGGATSGASGTVSDSEWSNTLIFSEYIKLTCLITYYSE